MLVVALPVGERTQEVALKWGVVLVLDGRAEA